MIVVHTKVQKAARRIQQRFRMRGLEWEHSIMTLLWGMFVLGNPGQFSGPGFVVFVAVAEALHLNPPALWGWACVIAGALRIAALCINGYVARPTALIRVIAGVSGVVLFAAISLGFLFTWRWGTALSMYPVVGFFGLFSVYWAITDVAIPDDHRHDEPA